MGSYWYMRELPGLALTLRIVVFEILVLVLTASVTLITSKVYVPVLPGLMGITAGLDAIWLKVLSLAVPSGLCTR